MTQKAGSILAASEWPNSNNSQQYLNLNTNGLVQLIPVEKPKPRTRFAYPGGYFTMSLIDAKRLIELKMPADGYRLAISVATKSSQVTGLVHFSNEEYGEELGLRPQRVSDLFSILKKHGLVRRLNNDTILVNPRWCFRGTPQQQRDAIEEWAKFVRPVMVRGGKRKGKGQAA